MNEEFIEKALRKSLRREAAPADFAAKVLAGVKTASVTQMKPKQKPWLARPMTLALAAAIGAMAIIPSAVLEYHRREEAKGQKAKHDLLIALAITRNQLQQVRQKVQHTGNAQ
jgi:F0F1-type ATP synthase delta subunit